MQVNETGVFIVKHGYMERDATKRQTFCLALKELLDKGDGVTVELLQRQVADVQRRVDAGESIENLQRKTTKPSTATKSERKE